MHRGLKSAGLALAAAMVLAGSASAQRGGGFGFGRGGGITMLRAPEVQAELKLTDEQKTKVTALMEQRRGQGRGQGGQDLSPAERQQRAAERRAAEDKDLGAILNADQMKRYNQLRLQQQGMTALAEKPVADELKLTDDQKTKIEGIIEAQRAEIRSAFQGGGDGGDREARREKMMAMRKQTDDKIAALLTEEQKNKWKEMVGAPFTFPTGRQAI